MLNKIKVSAAYMNASDRVRLFSPLYDDQFRFSFSMIIFIKLSQREAGVRPSGLARWLVDLVLAVVGSNPSHG